LIRRTEYPQCHKTQLNIQLGQGVYYAVYVRNPSVSLSPTLTKNENVEHYIRIKTYKLIALKFWVESGVSVLCG